MEAFRKALEIVKKPGNFAVTGVVDNIVLPCLRVDGCEDIIGLPVSRSVCRALVNEEGSLSIPARNIEFLEKGWAVFAQEIATEAARQLGVCSPVQAQLRQLSVTEKERRCSFPAQEETGIESPERFASLVISLPAEHCEAALCVEYMGRELLFPCSHKRGGRFSLGWCAFYDECSIKAAEVSEGHQVLLVYALLRDCATCTVGSEGGGEESEVASEGDES